MADAVTDAVAIDLPLEPGIRELCEAALRKLQHAGFEVDSAIPRELDWDFEDWMRTMAVPAPLAAELAEVVESAEGEARRQLRPERRDGRLWHAYWHALIRAERPG